MDIEAEILRELVNNNKDLNSDPNKYVFSKDIGTKLDYSKGYISKKIRQLKDDNYIKINKVKTEISSSFFMNNMIVYEVTNEGKSYGGLGSEFPNFTATPSRLDNLHNLCYKYQVKSFPDSNPYFEDPPNILNHGTKHYIKRILLPKSRQKCTIEMFVGKHKTTITMKPYLTEGNTPDDLKKYCDSLSYYYHHVLTKYGYELSLPERKGEGKITLRGDMFKTLGDLGITEGDGWYLDESEGEWEFHAKKGSLEDNCELATYLNDVSQMVDLKKEVRELRGVVGELVDIIKPEEGHEYEGYMHG